MKKPKKLLVLMLALFKHVTAIVAENRCLTCMQLVAAVLDYY